MKYQIDKDILNNTTNCSDDFSCLSGNDTCLCEVDKYIESEDSVLFIKPMYEYCKNELSFGNSFFCICPIRKEIYKNYKI